MGFFGALGGAIKKPFAPINKAVSKVPGMQTMGKPFGMAQPAKPPNQGMMGGVGPSMGAMSKFGMMGQKMQQPSPPIGMPPSPPIPQQTTPSSIPQQLSPDVNPLDQSPMEQAIQREQSIQQNQGDMYKPDVMPQTGGEEAIGNIQGLAGQMNQGLGPSPRMMPRRPMMRPQFRGRM